MHGGIRIGEASHPGPHTLQECMDMIMEQGLTINRLSLQISDLLTKIDKLTSGAGTPGVRAGAPRLEIASEPPARRVTYDLGDDKAKGSPKLKIAAKLAAAAKPKAQPKAKSDNAGLRQDSEPAVRPPPPKEQGGAWTTETRKRSSAPWQLRAADFDADIISFKDLPVALEDRKRLLLPEADKIWRRIVQVADMEEEETCRALLKLFPTVAVLIVRMARDGSRSFPGTIGTKLALRKVETISFQGAGAAPTDVPRMKRTVAIDTPIEVREATTYKVRLVFAQELMDTEDLQGGPEPQEHYQVRHKTGHGQSR